MPSLTHESLVDLFRECPALGPELLRLATNHDLPAGTTPRETAAEFSDVQPAEYRADVVVRLDRPDGKVAEIIIVEIQLERDSDKRFTWPLYQTSARARFRCPATVLVIALDDAVARWCAEPIPLDRGNLWRPIVLGPSAIPRITELDQARALPELAVLSATAHGRDPDAVETVATALAACDPLDNPRATLYADLIFAGLNEATRRALETLMQTRKYAYQSDFAKKYFAQGREEGHQEGQRAILLRQLKWRFGELSDDVRGRIADANTDELDRWAQRILTADSLADIFADS